MNIDSPTGRTILFGFPALPLIVFLGVLRHRALDVPPPADPIQAASASAPQAIVYGGTVFEAAPQVQEAAESFMTACEKEIGLFCHAVKDQRGPALRCLRRRRDDLLPACRDRLEAALRPTHSDGV